MAVELEFIDWLNKRTTPQSGIVVGIGDDAALLKVPAGRQLVVTTDMLVEGVHFDLADATAERVGRKALGVNLSDLAAEAASPLAALVSLSLPKKGNALELAKELLEGMMPLANKHRCPIVGGDTNVAAGPLTISVTAMGTVAENQAWLRSGAQPGDRLLVTGQLGGSLLGRHLDFEPRVAEAMAIRDRYEVHAALDISDGLALDLARMLAASGVGAIVEVDRIPISSAAVTMAQRDGKAPLDHALGDGEDFELLLALPPDEAKRLCDTQPLQCGWTDIGEITQTCDCKQRHTDGTLTTLEPLGYQH